MWLHPACMPELGTFVDSQSRGRLSSTTNCCMLPRLLRHPSLITPTSIARSVLPSPTRRVHHTTMAPAPFPDPASWPADKVRRTFVDFFEQNHGHTFWKSASVIPFEDRESRLSFIVSAGGDTRAQRVDMTPWGTRARLRHDLVPAHVI